MTTTAQRFVIEITVPVDGDRFFNKVNLSSACFYRCINNCVCFNLSNR